MKVLLINGSPNAKGCTYTALTEVAGALKKEGIETEIFHIGNAAIRGCIGCWACSKNPDRHCVFNDDIVNTAIEKIKEADGYIFGSPVHFAGASGFLTPFLDRIFVAAKPFMEYKPGACISSARRSGTTATFDQLNKYFSISNMPIVSANYWNMVHGGSPEDVKQDLEGLQIMRTLGRNMAWMLKCIEAGKNAGVTLPTTERAAKTNFIK